MSGLPRTPWLDNYGEIPFHLEYFEGKMFDAVKNIAEQYPDNIAFDFMGAKTTYSAFVNKIVRVSYSLSALGIKKDDRVILCMPNCPQTVVLFYAINYIGAVACMIHPLSAEKEIEFYINDSKSVAVVTLDQFYPKFKAISENNSFLLILTSISDALSEPLKTLYKLTEGRKIPSIPEDASVIRWADFLKAGKVINKNPYSCYIADKPAVILYSGGTTGKSKGVLLSDKNFNALGKQIIVTNPMFCIGDKMLAVMPVFHGFGLGVSIHSMLMNGGRCILVPRFTPESYAKLIKKSRCNFIAGVPTLFEALIRQHVMKNADLSHLKGVFSGGDSLPVELKKRFDSFLMEHNCDVKIREGYGTTECVTASCLTPIHLAKEGSIGQPFPDTYYKIVKVGTTDEVEYGLEGEICISGPTVMLGYLDREKETADVLKTHGDGLCWVHTGDLGFMDNEGFVYFKQRLKRVIITNGYNVYPSAIENVLDSNELVELSCVIGVSDSLKMQKVKAYVVLKDGVPADEKTRNSIMDFCRKRIAKYALPYEIEFRDTLPKTLVGKVAYRVLEEENNNTSD